MKHAKKAVAGATAALVIAAVIPFTKGWEGTDLVAKRDMIGTGNPITYCSGLTAHDGKVKVGQRFTQQQCDKLLRPAMLPYWNEIVPCIHVALPVKTAASLLDAAFNAGSPAVCHSPMLVKMNAGDLKGGCAAFPNWYTTTKNHGIRKVVPGLINRRKGDYRLGEKGLCLQGVKDGIEKPPARKRWWTDPPSWASLLNILG